MRPLILVFFLFITLMDSYFYGQSLHHYRYIVEPLLIPSLFLYYLLSSKKRTTLVLFAFLFVWLGDVLLMIERSPIFLQWAVFF